MYWAYLSSRLGNKCLQSKVGTFHKFNSQSSDPSVCLPLIQHSKPLFLNLAKSKQSNMVYLGHTVGRGRGVVNNIPGWEKF